MPPEAATSKTPAGRFHSAHSEPSSWTKSAITGWRSAAAAASPPPEVMEAMLSELGPELLHDEVVVDVRISGHRGTWSEGGVDSARIISPTEASGEESTDKEPLERRGLSIPEGGALPPKVFFFALREGLSVARFRRVPNCSRHNNTHTTRRDNGRIRSRTPFVVS